MCGHSYGGMVITGVAAEMGERIKSLVYLDAFLPEDGQSLFDLVGPDMAMQFLGLVKSNGGMLPPIPAAAFNVNAADAAWVDRTCVPQSLLTFTEGVRYSPKVAAVRNRTYILATGYDMHVFDQFYEKVKKDSKWKAVAGAVRPRRHARPSGRTGKVAAGGSRPIANRWSRRLRLELGVPIEIVEPALVQIVGREQPAVAVQVLHRSAGTASATATCRLPPASGCPCADCRASRRRRR